MDAKKLEAMLGERFGPDELKRDEPMSAHTTFRCGGLVDFLVEPHDARGVSAAVDAARAAGAPWRVIGCGSNVLVADAGLSGLVVKLGERFASIEVDGTRLRAQAGATNAQVAEAAHAAGLSGYEFASGIPGSVGGAAFMNAGAYGGEFKDVACAVTCLTPDGRLERRLPAQAGWGYRRSAMQGDGSIVLAAELELAFADKEEIAAVMADLRRRRESKQPLELGSAGSTFKRPEGYFAGKLVQDAGMQGHRVGGAQVSPKHAGFVVNNGSATAADVLQVIRDVQHAVYETQGVRLEPELRLWGFDDA